MITESVFIIGSAEALPVREVRSVREREREIQREWDGSDVTLVALKLARNRGRAHYVIESKVQWKPFWLAIQQYPQNDWLGGNLPYTMTYAHGPHFAPFVAKTLKLAMNFAPFLAKNLHLGIGEEFCTFPGSKIGTLTRSLPRAILTFHHPGGQHFW